MKLMSFIRLLAASAFILSTAYAVEKTPSEFNKVMALYSQGKYQSTVDELNSIEHKFKSDKKNKGLVNYWKGMAYNRQQFFAEAIESFQKAKSLGFDTPDFNYEYGQALFAADKLGPARIQFNESFKKGYKRATCLYYMAYVAKEVGEEENARTLYGAVKKLEAEEGKDVIQPAEMQLADMELEIAEKQPDVFRHVESKVIPIYENAYKMNPDSPLAPKIKEKIRNLQKKYELVLFQLRNGRPTAYPPYYLRIAQELGWDSNVTFAPTETTISKSKQGSTFSKTDVMGRYTFYHKDYIGVAPELKANLTRYFNREPNIYRNDNYIILPAIRGTYEHTLWNKPATHIFDYEYSEVHRDIYTEKELSYATSSHALVLGERFNYFKIGQSTLRVRARKFSSYLDTSNSNTLSLIYEQIVGLKDSTVLIFSSLDRTRVKSDLFDSNSWLMRADWLLPKYKDWFTPSVGFALTLIDPINNRDSRGLEYLMNPNVRLSRRFGKHWGANFRAEYMQQNSKDKANFAFKKNLAALELEYLF